MVFSFFLSFFLSLFVRWVSFILVCFSYHTEGEYTVYVYVVVRGMILV